ncbi:Carbohydrate-binding WSC subgroup [Penicillium cf. griseofulvum]|uniref:Carbohydrate-binding WSC subgroup n=1 Tax=Penicillium cf. griseofulvum TaxID=2972120 RepID=A0A9W9T1N7_9EURO|nr:Carbohydrate-binding WSC subgroup [Penicillium cf. griseofulvum]KAJ5440811.1 Carbohydrate-binding WSC subgroup [Penicillium cf. griseofulvum]KAJ5448857.1 Carbohydrate-binding WSC subgroup [Penicillium cf. griseofulvum]
MLFNTQGALAVSGMLMAATSAVAKDFKVLPRGQPIATLQGCYSGIPGYGKPLSWTFQSSGWCLDHCGKEYATFALTGGSDCVCGNTMPPTSAKVSTDKCSKSCSGWPDDMCGGTDYYSVYTTNLKDNVPTYEDDTKSTTTTTSSGSKTTTTDEAASTASTSSSVRTETATSEASASTVPEDIDEKSSKSKNTAAIAAGVVIGVVGFAALCGAIFFWWRSKKNKAGVAGGATGGYGRDSGPPSMSDSRFDGDYMAQRRQSNGSIDDDHDFSRRILQVTNPDR